MRKKILAPSIQKTQISPSTLFKLSIPPTLHLASPTLTQPLKQHQTPVLHIHPDHSTQSVVPLPYLHPVLPYLILYGRVTVSVS